MQYMYEYLFIVSVCILSRLLVVFGELVILVICVYWTDFSAREYSNNNQYYTDGISIHLLFKITIRTVCVTTSPVTSIISQVIHIH
jgi:hypothetical protein